MNWSKGFLIFSLFVLGVSVIYFVVTSYQLHHLAEPEVTLGMGEEEVVEIPQIDKQYVFLETQDSLTVEGENITETANDVSADSIVDVPVDELELEQASEDIADALSPEIKLKAERYAKLAAILPVIAELRYQNFKLAKQNEKYIEEHYRRFRLQGGPYPEPDPSVEDEFQKTKKILDQKESDYNRQIDSMFPELDLTYEEQGIDYIFLKDQVLRDYFGKKLPHDGNPDYFSSD
jgi:hypothetical protein